MGAGGLFAAFMLRHFYISWQVSQAKKSGAPSTLGTTAQGPSVYQTYAGASTKYPFVTPGR